MNLARNRTAEQHALNILLLILCAWGGPARAEIAASASARLDAPLLPYLRSATLTVKAEGPKGMTVQWPELVGKIKDVEITADPPVMAQFPNDRLGGERVYHLDAIKPGTYRLPDLDVTVTMGNESSTEALPPLVLKARDLTDEEKKSAAQFVESARLSALEQPRTHGVWWFVAGAAALAMALAAWKWLHRRNPLPTAPPKPAWEVAFARLNELRLRNLPIQGQTERYYVDLSAILRYYMEDRFGIRAPEQTTPEFLDIAAQSGLLTAEQQDLLGLFLRHSDRVKFARHEPSVAEMEQRLAEVEQFVHDTVPGADAAEPMEGAA